MVLFVYSVISPLTNFILAFVFISFGTLLRHQFIFVYPTGPDSGGKIWSNCIKILVTCMLVAEVTCKWAVYAGYCRVSRTDVLVLSLISAWFVGS